MPSAETAPYRGRGVGGPYSSKVYTKMMVFPHEDFWSFSVVVGCLMMRLVGGSEGSSCRYECHMLRRRLEPQPVCLKQRDSAACLAAYVAGFQDSCETACLSSEATVALSDRRPGYAEGVAFTRSHFFGPEIKGPSAEKEEGPTKATTEEGVVSEATTFEKRTEASRQTERPETRLIDESRAAKETKTRLIDESRIKETTRLLELQYGGDRVAIPIKDGQDLRVAVASWCRDHDSKNTACPRILLLIQQQGLSSSA